MCKRQPAGHAGGFPETGLWRRRGDAAPGMGLQSCLVGAQSFTSFLSYSARSCLISSICDWISLELFSIILNLKEKTEMLLCACRNQFNSWITISKVKQARLLLDLARYELDVQKRMPGESWHTNGEQFCSECQGKQVLLFLTHCKSTNISYNLFTNTIYSV